MSRIFLSHRSTDKAWARELKELLEASGHVGVFVDDDPETGIPYGQDWERELYRTVVNCRAVVILHSKGWSESKWCFAELTQARALGKFIIPLRLDDHPLDALLSDTQAIPMTDGIAPEFPLLERSLRMAGIDPADSFAWKGNRDPYPGLVAFEEEDAAVFFGRDTEIRNTLDLLSRVRRRGGGALAMVLGASGSGKSSLIRAGVVPRLRRDTDHWIVTSPFRPGRDPMRRLAEVLSATFAQAGEPRQVDVVEAQLRRAAPVLVPEPAVAEPEAVPATPGAVPPPPPPPPRPDPLPPTTPIEPMTIESEVDLPSPNGHDGDVLGRIADELRHATGRTEARLLIVVDQFEELLGGDGGDHDVFLDLLAQTIDDARGILVVGTLRSDFLGAFQNARGIPSRYDVQLVGPLVDGVEEVIREPAVVAGVEIEPALVDRIADDTRRANALPLLAFTLHELWVRCGDDRRLTLDEYVGKIGGIDGAIQRSAEELRTDPRVGEAGEQQLRQAFVSMARRSHEGAWSRRVIRRADVPASIVPVLEDFEKKGLIVPDKDEHGAETWEVAHEALFRAWTPLRRWLDEDAELVGFRDDITNDAAQWAAAGDEDKQSFLWSGIRLDRAVEMENDGRLTLEDEAAAFVAASKGEVEARRQARRKARRRRFQLALLVAFWGVLLAGFAFVSCASAENERDNATEARRIADDNAALAAQNERVAKANEKLAEDNAEEAELNAKEAVARADQATATVLAARSRTLAATNPALALALAAEATAVTDTAQPDAVAAVVGARSSFAERRWQRVGVPLFTGGTSAWTVAYHPDGDQIATGDDDGIQIWDEQSRTVIADLNQHGDRVRDLAYSAGGRFLVSASNDGTARLWDVVDDYEPLGVLDHQVGNGVTIQTVAFAPDASAVFTGDTNGDVWWWDVDTGDGGRFDRVLGPDDPTPERVNAVAVSPDGAVVASGDADGQITLFDVATRVRTAGRLVAPGDDTSVESLAFHPSDPILVAGHRSGTIWRWERPLGPDVEALAIDGHLDWVRALAFDPENRDRLASAGNDRTVRLWSLDERRPIETPLRDHSDTIVDLAFGPDGSRMASASTDGTMIVWGEPAPSAFGDEVVSHAGDDCPDDECFATAVSFSSDDRVLASTGFDGTLRLWDVLLDRPVGEPIEVGARLFAVAFSPVDPEVLIVGAEGGVWWWDVDDNELVASWEGRHPVRAVAISRDGALAASADDNGVVRIWDVATRTEVREQISIGFGVDALSFGPDDVLAVGTQDGDVVFFDDLTGGLTSEPDVVVHDDNVRGVAFSPDGLLLASGSKDQSVLVSDVLSGGPPVELGRHDNEVSAVVFSPDGRLLASPSNDGTVRIWVLGDDLVGEFASVTTDAECVGSGDCQVLGAAFSNDGRVLATAEGDGSVRLWEQPADVARACELAADFVEYDQLDMRLPATRDVAACTTLPDPT